MNTLSMRVRYRPVRLGFCVEKGNLDDLQKSLQLTHAFWGGHFNPIIPIGVTAEDTQLSQSLVNAFHIDVLFPVRETDALNTFINKYPYLGWPTFDRVLFSHRGDRIVAEFLDIYHPVRTIFEKHIQDKSEPRAHATLYEWTEDDPLKYVFQAQFGQYPSPKLIQKDYTNFVSQNLRGKHEMLDVNKAIPSDAFGKITPSALSGWDLDWDGNFIRHEPGFYLGNASDFDDLVNFWNLRAANIDLMFFDPAHSARFDELKTGYLKMLAERPRGPAALDNRTVVWQKSREMNPLTGFGPDVIGATASTTIWNGLNVTPTRMYITEHSVLASVDEGVGAPRVSFQLSEKPFCKEWEFYDQKLVVSVHPIVDFKRQFESTLAPPYIPELNEYYGREVNFDATSVRSEVESLGIITGAHQNDLTLRALPSTDLISKIFTAFGMKAEMSRPGIVANRLIKQMGGLQGCRVFKARGVRKLIEKYGPLESFSRSGAIQTIGEIDKETGLPNFSRYENLYVDGEKLKPERAFEYLLKTGVFRVGLKLKCSNCELDFWMALDELATEVRCELCGRTFNITSQLKDRDWAYRRSGIFGREDHQEGSIPVALTLQQLDTVFSGELIFSTAMKIVPGSASISPCETDFVLVGKPYWRESVPLAIGECKSNHEITEQDVANLTRIADAFPPQRIACYIIFSKTSGFSQEEIDRCRAARSKTRPRVILLSDRELEPYFLYELSSKEFALRNMSAISLEDMAINTQNIYFEPKRK